MTTQASIYVRISLDRTGEALGVERQETACREFCAARGWEVAAVHVDNDISATTGKRRPAFEALLASRPDVIVVWHTDRLVRLSRDLERVIDLGVNVHAIAAGHVDLSNPAGRAVAKTITAWAQYEGEQKGERMRLASAQRALAGKPPTGARALGWLADNVTPHPTEAPIVATAYADTLAGLSLRAIAKEWNEAGLVTTRGGAWRPDAVRYVLTNPRNAGLRAARVKNERTWRIIGNGTWDGLVSEDTFRAVADLLSDPVRRTTPDTRRKYFLSGLARCGVCGAPCNTGGTTRPGRPTQRTLKCSVTKHLQVGSGPVEAWVSEVVIARLSRDDAATCSSTTNGPTWTRCAERFARSARALLSWPTCLPMER